MLAYFSLFLKTEVHDMKVTHQIITEQIANNHNELHMLKAELVHLQSPERLRKLAEQFLTLRTTGTNQLTTDPTSPTASTKIVARSLNNLPKARVAQWRYKHSHYSGATVHQASHKKRR